ncbi:hypothetical protein B0H13DRAFT_1992608 [Mycena leptocephala]|nr:hypothetical protein B0H13DRAFT_1992608 [Mycena leptocephala]
MASSPSVEPPAVSVEASLVSVEAPIPLRTMTIQELAEWIRATSPDIQTLAVSDICWWAERTVLQHQFLVLRFQYAGQSYELKIERAGKLIWSPSRVAIDQATIRLAAPTRDSTFEARHRLLFALLTDRAIIPERSFIYDGFVDFLDHKWRGPPPKLIDVARYAAAIRAEETRYNLTNTNCYWFSRVLFHTLALRHYAFPFIASCRAASANYQAENAAKKYRWTRYAPADWRHYDPSSTGIVFRFLAYQEDDSGTLFLARFGIIIKVLATTIGVCGALVILPALITAEIRGRVLTASILALIATCTLFVGASLQIARLLDFSIRAPMRLKRQCVLDMFEADQPPQSRRGDYVLTPIPIEPRDDRIQLLPRHARNGSRRLPSLWEHDAQIFAERETDYWTAWLRLHGYSATPDGANLERSASSSHSAPELTDDSHANGHRAIPREFLLMLTATITSCLSVMLIFQVLKETGCI